MYTFISNIVFGLISVAFIGAAVWAFIASIQESLQKMKTRIAMKAIRSNLADHYGHGEWKCVKIVEDGMGFMGLPAVNIVLERGNERVQFCFTDSRITEGVPVKLRLRTDDEMRNYCWIGIVDQYMTPALQ